MKGRIWRLLAILLILTAFGLGLFWFLTVRCYKMEFVPGFFTQSSRRLGNPDRGFYSIQGYTIQPEPQQFQLPQKTDDHRVLELVQINLKQFRTGAISDTGLQNVENLFRCLEEGQKRYIVRFLYDWDGNASSTEPESIDVILNHMRQLSPILKEYAHCIFVLQGLFIGNWGEMNGTHFAGQESVAQLAAELAGDTAEETFLSVRTPVYWRKIIGGERFDCDNPLAARLGLYNDGILGNSGDCGTYVGTAEDRSNAFVSWNRADELAFQEELCKQVPNGGEVILENPLNDFESALEALRTMRVTYLNWDYDRAVLDKWAASVVAEEGCFYGMDGLTYIERHLGYRYFLDGGDISYDFLKNRIYVTAKIRNVGFAPVYGRKPMTITLCSGEEVITLTPEGDLRQAVGGNQREEILNVCAALPASALKQTSYQAYLQIWDPVTDAPLELANEQTAGEYGYYLGTCSFERLPWYDRLSGSD